MAVKALSDHQLLVIEQHIARWLSLDVGTIDLRDDALALLREVARLRRENAALRSVVKNVADGESVYLPTEDVWVLLLKDRTLSGVQAVWHTAHSLMCAIEDNEE